MRNYFFLALFIALISTANAATTFYGNFNSSVFACGINTTSWPTSFTSASGITWNGTSQNGLCRGYYENTNAGAPFSAKVACSPLLNVTPNFVLTYWVYSSSVNAFDINNPEVWLSIWDSNNTVMRNMVDLGNTATTRGNQTMIKLGPSGSSIEHFFNGSQVSSSSGSGISYDTWHNVTIQKLSNGTMRLFLDTIFQYATASNSTIEKNNTYLCLAAHRGRTVFFDNVTLGDGVGIAATTINTTRQEYLEYEDAYVSASVVGATVGDNLTFAYTIWYANGTGELMQRYTFVTVTSNFSYTNTVNLGNNTNRSEIRGISLFVNSTTSQIFNFTFPNVSVTVYKPTLDNCTLTQTPAINFSVWDENGFGPLYNSTVEFNGNITAVTSRAYLFSLQYNTSNTNNGSVCIYPSWASYTLRDAFTYYKSGYSRRNFYITAAISNVSFRLDFYLLSNADSSELDFTVKNSLNTPLSNYVIHLQRFFSSTNSYITVAQALTDYAGRSFTYVYQPSTSYRVLIFDSNGTQVYSASPVVIDSSIQTGTNAVTGNGIYALEFVIGGSTSVVYGQFGRVSASCTFTNSTATLSCTVLDPTGAAAYSQLEVKNSTITGWVTVCQSNAAGPSSTLVCVIPGWNNSLYNYVLKIYNYDGTYFTAFSGNIAGNARPIDWGVSGYLLTLFMVLALAGLGTFNPNAALILAAVGLTVSWLVGAFAVGIGSLISIVLVIAIIYWKSRA